MWAESKIAAQIDKNNTDSAFSGKILRRGTLNQGASTSPGSVG